MRRVNLRRLHAAEVCVGLALCLAIDGPKAVRAQTLPPVRTLGPITHVSTSGMLGSVSTVRPLPSGQVIVNDISRRQLVLLDADLRTSKVIADSTAATGRAYGVATDGLMTFTADSSIFVDAPSQSMSVLDPNGLVARVMSAPAEARYLVGGPFGTPGFDPKGRLVFRGMPPIASSAAGESRADNRGPRFPQYADSAPIIRLNLQSRRRDTVAYVKVPRETVSASRDVQGRPGPPKVIASPLPVIDAWALLPDGSVAVLRGADYHLEIVSMNGARRVFAKFAHPWQRLTDDEKQSVIDSAQVEEDKVREALKRAVLANPTASAGAIPETPGRPAGVTVTVLQGRGAGTAEFQPTRVVMIPAKELPDYRPAFRLDALRVDHAGNLWVRTTLPGKPGAIYDVIGQGGAIFDRVAVPYGRSIVGFGEHVAYLSVLDENGARLERARLRQ